MAETLQENGRTASPDRQSPDKSIEDDQNDVSSEVSFLSLNAAGERQFLGSASGVLFADLVRATVDSAAPDSHHATWRERDDDVGNNVRSVTVRGPITTVSKEALPPLNIAMELVSGYFSHDHVSYPFLHCPTIMHAVGLIYSDPSFYAENHFAAFAFDMMLAIATANVYKFDLRLLPGAESHHERAMLRINEVLRAGGIKPLQSILLLCQYRMCSSIQDTSASMWHLVGIAVRMSLELGLHRESIYEVRPPRSESQVEDPEFVISREVRRRCFWCVFALDRIVSITLGRPLALRMEDIDVQLPSTDDTVSHSHAPDLDNLNSGLPSPMTNGTPLDDSNRSDRLSPTAESNIQISIFVHIVRYRILCGKILVSLHASKPPAGHSERDICNLRDQLAIELDEWRQQTDLLRFSDVHLCSTRFQARSSFSAKEWYELLYHNAILMLYRPSPMLSGFTKDGATLHKILNSARQSISLYAYLHRSRKINYSWITLHSVFMAGLSYIYAVGRHFRERRKANATGDNTASQGLLLSPEPNAIDIVNVTRACSNLLVAISERWNAPRNCYEVFDRLSNAVVADAIYLQSMPSGHQRESSTSLNQSPQRHLPAALPDISGANPGVVFYANDDVSAGAPFFNYQNGTPLTIDNEFRNCFDDLQNLYHQQYVDDPVMRLSQDWLGEIEGFDSMFRPPMSSTIQFAMQEHGHRSN